MNMDLEKIRKELNEAIAEVLEKNGMTGKLGTITYNDYGFHSSLSAKAIEVNGKSGDQIEYERFAPKFGIDPNSYGRVFKNAEGIVLTIVGINPKARTYPVIARDGACREYKCPASCTLFGGIKNV